MPQPEDERPVETEAAKVEPGAPAGTGADASVEGQGLAAPAAAAAPWPIPGDTPVPGVLRAIITIGGGIAAATAEPEETDRPLSEQHRTELSTYRTMGLREALADDPEAAFIAVLHAMVIRVIVNGYRTGSCLEVSTISARADHTGWPEGAVVPDGAGEPPVLARELAEVCRIVLAGARESGLHPLAASLASVRVLQEARAQTGVRFPGDAGATMGA